MFSSHPASLVFLACLVGVPAPGPADEMPPAVRLWQQGQDAMLQDQPDRAIACFNESLKLDPALTRNFLSLAAAFLHKGEDEKAAPWLARHLAAQPDHLTARLHYAELLWKLHRPEPAAVEFQRFVVEVQQRDPQPAAQLVQAHTQLMEIAAARKDTSAEHLHRGIGLFWLALLKADAGNDEDGTPESLLCKAAAELMQARRAAPGTARPCWYLHRVWATLGQQQTARKWLRETEQASTAPGHDLTPAEVHDLQIACAAREGERRR
jgi:Tfp pilus assembly protein PilF